MEGAKHTGVFACGTSTHIYNRQASCTHLSWVPPHPRPAPPSLQKSKLEHAKHLLGFTPAQRPEPHFPRQPGLGAAPWIAAVPSCLELPTTTISWALLGTRRCRAAGMLGEVVTGTHLHPAPPPAPHGGYFPQHKSVPGWHIAYKQSRKSRSSGRCSAAARLPIYSTVAIWNGAWQGA